MSTKRGDYGKGMIRPRETKKGTVYDLELPVPGRRPYYKGGFKTQKLAKVHRDQILRARNAAALLNEKSVTVSQIVGRWMKETASEKAGSTVVNYESAYRRYIEPDLRTPVSLFTRKAFQEYLDALPNRLEKGKTTGYSTVRCIMTMVKAALRWAATPEQGIINDSPLRDARLRLPMKGAAPKAVGLGSFRDIMQASDGKISHLLWLVLGSSGARRGEILGLRWRDVDFNERVIRIGSIATPESRGAVVEERVKGKQWRAIPLDDATLQAFQVRFEDVKPKADTFVFESKRKPGQPYGYNAVDNWWRRDCRKAGVPYGRGKAQIHGLRRMFVTEMIDRQVPVKVVSEIVGHTSTMITENVYFVASDSRKREAINTMGSLLGE